MSFSRRLLTGLFVGALFFAMAFAIGLLVHKIASTLSLIGTSVLLEAQPAAVASLPLRFNPFAGAMISILGNLVPLPVLMLTFDEITNGWSWMRRILKKSQSWSQKYGKYGVFVLVPLSPVLGAYVCIGIGYLMRWNPRRILFSVLIGMVLSTFVITYGGESIIRYIRPYV